jgi:GntR family transcriptional regulator
MNSASLQAQIKQILRAEITAGVWRQGDKLPPEPELMRRFGVSRITVGTALRDLAAEGLVVRYQGRGTFVSSHPQGWTNLGALLQRMPRQAADQPLAHSLNRVEQVVPPDDIALDLGLSQGDRCWRFIRIKQVAGAPAQWEQAFIPSHWVLAAPAAGEEWGQYLFIEILSRLTGQEARRCRAFLRRSH